MLIYVHNSYTFNIVSIPQTVGWLNLTVWFTLIATWSSKVADGAQQAATINVKIQTALLKTYPLVI